MRIVVIGTSVAVVMVAVGLTAPDAAGHGGGLDGYGCHHNRKLGGYHCHRGAFAGRAFGSKSEMLRSLQDGGRPSSPRRRTTTRSQPTPSSPKIITGQASVIDGDTIDIRGTRIRLHGIDAPESRQSCRDNRGATYRCGQRAAMALSGKIRRQTMSCQRTDTDRYGRTVAVCWLKAENVNAWMVREGWAIAYRRFSNDYVLHEDAAKRAKRGVWSGKFMTPEGWRRAKRR